MHIHHRHTIMYIIYNNYMSIIYIHFVMCMSLITTLNTAKQSKIEGFHHEG